MYILRSILWILNHHCERNFNIVYAVGKQNAKGYIRQRPNDRFTIKLMIARCDQHEKYQFQKQSLDTSSQFSVQSNISLYQYILEN